MSGDYHQLNMLINHHGAAYSYSFEWYPTPGGRTAVHGKWFTSKEEADASRNRALKQLGYTKPRWWQWWRWNEHKIAVDS